MEEKKNEEKLEIEKRTLEQLFKDLREDRNWTYINIVEELNKLGVIVDEKLVKKWEIGLEYPDLDTFYKLSELYSIPSENFIIAKTNSLNEGLQSIHMVLIKWICYFTDISLKVALIVVYTFIALALIGSFMFFIDKAETFVEVRRRMN